VTTGFGDDLLSAEVDPDHRLVEIACDESGAEGEKLIDGNSSVFAHASVQVSMSIADDCVREMRDRIRSPARCYKAGDLARAKNRPTLIWLLDPSGPVYGRALVHLIEKKFFLLIKIVEVFTDDEALTPEARQHDDQKVTDMACTLYKDGSHAFGRGRWHSFLECFNDLMRARTEADVKVFADSLFSMIDVLRIARQWGRAGEVMELFWQSRLSAESFFLDERRRDSRAIPPLDPLFPAITRGVTYWSDDRRPVSVVHDRQVAITPESVEQLKVICGKRPPDFPGQPAQNRLAEFNLIESSADSRVQLADILAGIVRGLAAHQLAYRSHPGLDLLLEPYMDPHSIWGDQRSWSALRPSSAGQP
jgi:hypothetical protein